MSVDNPVYTGNVVQRFFEHFGHDIHLGLRIGEAVVTKLPTVIRDIQSDQARVVPLVQAVIAKSIALAKAAVPVETAVAALGANVPADLAAVSSVSPLETAVADLFDAIKALAIEIGVDWNQLAADLLAAPAPTTTPSVTGSPTAVTHAS